MTLAGGSWRQANIVSYDPNSRDHVVQYTRDGQEEEEVVSYDLKEGRYQRETGNALFDFFCIFCFYNSLFDFIVCCFLFFVGICRILRRR